MSPQGKLWFRRKRFGWGWSPASVEGWLSIGAYLLIVLALHAARNVSPAFSFIGIALATAGLIALGFFKGEPPKWQWGRRDR
ncbi:hypothetical protein [Novosphingobium rosa]|uniref:hypothetical protein n=1 Tax=Novosphingobium rosa TaxID=76978 RepID=UPI00082BFA19|nr:hypothetical protein [Novosphingobium rosa]